MSYTQIKLSNGEEIICNIVDEPNETDVNLVVEKAMAINVETSADGNIRYYTFRPWMIYQVKDEYFQLINMSHIVGEATPDPYVINQYKSALDIELAKKHSEAHIDDEDTEDLLTRILGNIAENKTVNDLDSDEDGTVISLFDKKKLH